MYSSSLNNKIVFGPVGSTGADGPTGNIGSVGTPGATGNTGPVGLYVVSSSNIGSQIILTLSDGTQIGVTGNFNGNSGSINTVEPESVGSGIEILGTSAEGELRIKGISGDRKSVV